jgi:multiple sugar transport system permease protein
MVAPALLGLLLFVGLPFVLAVVLSFTNLRLGSPLPTEGVGLEQYRRVLGDASFQRALINNAVFAVVVVPLQTALALALALLLHQRRGSAVLRTLFFMPVVFPMAMVAVVWELIYAPGPTALLNHLLQVGTLGAWTPRDFLHDPHLALPALMVLSIWQGLGFQMVVLLAGLQSIPAHLYEAAVVDGAGRRQRFWHVTLPQLRNPLLFVLLVTSLLAFRLFDQVQILTQGGPNDATTTVMFETVNAAFARQQVGRASAMTVVFFVLVLAITLLWRRFLREERETP